MENNDNACVLTAEEMREELSRQHALRRQKYESDKFVVKHFITIPRRRNEHIGFTGFPA